MKNLHVLPTDKPSRLSINCETDKLQLGFENRMFHDSINIYITSDEKVKDKISMGDYVLNLKIMSIIRVTETSSGLFRWRGDNPNDFKKIILTTDPELIKDGVQVIPDGFLEWFVKNPTRKFVEVEKEIVERDRMFSDSQMKQRYDEVIYKIIIPKEDLEHVRVKNFGKFNESLEDHIIDDENPLDPSEQEIKDLFYKWYDSVDYSEADYASFKAGYKSACGWNG